MGLLEGMPIAEVMASVKTGVGGTLGSLALVLGIWCHMLGKLMADSGGAQRVIVGMSGGGDLCFCGALITRLS